MRSVIAPLLAIMGSLNQQLAYSDATIEHLAIQDPRVPRLRSVPGVGPVTAADVSVRHPRRPFPLPGPLWPHRFHAHHDGPAVASRGQNSRPRTREAGLAITVGIHE